MKRRTIDASKLRRPLKKSRITDTVNGSWLLYVRFFVVWLTVVTMDFILEFRFEFLWPFWLLLRSTYDSFRYQGMGLTILFLVLTICSDVLFLLFLPVHWLFFVASTYVWVQFVCNSDRGPCIPTISLWLLFVYVEASVRLREVRSMPFHLDLCRPFAAHCIGYPVVNLGYGFKSYIGYKIRHFKQEEVAKENDFYLDLLSYALPPELIHRPLGEKDEYSSLHQRKNNPPLLTNGITTRSDIEALLASEARKRGVRVADIKADLDEKQGTGCLSLSDLEIINSIPVKEFAKKNGLCLDSTSESSFVKVPNGRLNQSKPLSASHASSDIKRSGSSKSSKKGSDDDDDASDSEASSASSSFRASHESSPKTLNRSCRSSLDTNVQQRLKEEMGHRRKTEQQVSQLEAESKKLRTELSNLRQSEADLRAQVHVSSVSERYLKVELTQMKYENESLQQKINSLSNNKSQEKTLITSLEKKLRTERESRVNLENQLKDAKRRAKSELESGSPRLVENHDACYARQQELESEASKLQGLVDEANAKVHKLELEEQEAQRRQVENNNREKMKKDVELLTGALNAMQGKNIHLENSLSSETRLKLDLFSALGETRRQLEIAQSQLKTKNKEVEVLKGKIAEVMAVMPQQYPPSPLSAPINSSYSSMKHDSSFNNHIEVSTNAENGPSLPVVTSAYMKS